MINLDELHAAFIANGGKVSRIASGKRGVNKRYMSDVAHGDDDDRLNASQRLADSLERKAKRKAYRKARKAANRLAASHNRVLDGVMS